MLMHLFILLLLAVGGFFLLIIFSLFRASSRADEGEERILELIAPPKQVHHTESRELVGAAQTVTSD